MFVIRLVIVQIIVLAGIVGWGISADLSAGRIVALCIGALLVAQFAVVAFVAVVALRRPKVVKAAPKRSAEHLIAAHR